MTDTPWTPGPWQVSGVRNSFPIVLGRNARTHAVGPDGDDVAAVFYDVETHKGWADARLIASAPELVEVLAELLDSDSEFYECAIESWPYGDNPSPNFEKWETRARAVLSKARGEKP